MDLKTVLNEVRSWPVKDRLQLVEEICQDLGDSNSNESELTDDLKLLLDRRLSAHDADPEDVTTWDAIKNYVRRPR